MLSHPNAKLTPRGAETLVSTHRIRHRRGQLISKFIHTPGGAWTIASDTPKSLGVGSYGIVGTHMAQRLLDAFVRQARESIERHILPVLAVEELVLEASEESFVGRIARRASLLQHRASGARALASRSIRASDGGSAVVAVDGALVIAQGRYSVIGHGIDELGIRMQGYPPGYDLTVEAVDRGNLPVLCDDTACRLRA